MYHLYNKGKLWVENSNFNVFFPKMVDSGTFQNYPVQNDDKPWEIRGNLDVQT